MTAQLLQQAIKKVLADMEKHKKNPQLRHGKQTLRQLMKHNTGVSNIEITDQNIIMLAPIFSGEYEGVDNIILTSKYGKTKCATAKVVAGIITAILTTTLIAAFNLLLAFVFYGTEGLDCSILFAPSDYVEAFIPFNITCGIGLVRKYTRARKLTPRMLNELVEKIEVFNAEKIDGVWEQRLRIHYNCVGTIEIPTVLPLPIPEVSVNTRKGVVVNYAPCELAV